MLIISQGTVHYLLWKSWISLRSFLHEHNASNCEAYWGGSLLF